jgi:uncharacterized membrane protein YfcA
VFADDTVLLLTLAFLAIAVLYASVGHAGASGYLAAMSLLSVATPVMRPTALVLNLLVASIATVRFQRAGLLSWPLLWPFALGSIPFAFIGGAMTLPGQWYRIVVGIIIWLSAVRLWIDFRVSPSTHAPSRGVAIACGAVIGLLSGVTGVGGGIFLSPLLLFMGWAETRTSGGVSAAFILANSAAGLAGNPGSLQFLPPALPLWAGAAVIGGFIGAELGSRKFGTPAFRRVLSVVLLLSGAKLIFT